MAKSTLAAKIAKLAMEYEPYLIQRELSKTYYKFLQTTEPGYSYIPKDDRDNGFEKPQTALGMFFLRCWLASRNLSVGMEKWGREAKRGIKEGE